MTIRNRLRSCAEDRCGDAKAADVRIGLGYTAVRLDDDRTGLAYTFRKNLAAGCTVFDGDGPLAGRTARSILDFLDSPDLVESAIGLATVNALCNERPIRAEFGDVLKSLELDSSDTVGMVGFFGPLVPPIEKQVRDLRIFDKDSGKSRACLDPSEAARQLPECDIAIITSTAIINNTVDSLLQAASGCREIVLLGTSTPLVPEAFAGTPVTRLSGITIDHPEGILRTVSEGGGTRQFGPHATKWNVPIKQTS
jgi:uncharacterized protein